MALLFCDSFDHYDITRGIYKYDRGTPQVGSGGRRGSQCAGFAFNTAGLVRNLPAQTALVAGAAFYVTSSNYFSLGNKWGAAAIFNNSITSRSFLLGFGFQGITQCGLVLAPDGSLHVVRGAAFDLGSNSLASELVASSSATAVRFGQWTFIEMKVTPGSVVVRVNGVAVITASVSTIQNGMPSSYNQFYVHGGSSESADGGWTGKIDDLYLLNTSGAQNNDFLGDVRVDYCKPDGPGFYSQSSIIGTNPAATRWQSVDDQIPDDAVTGVELVAEGDRDLYTHENITYDEALVFGVQGVVYARRQDAGLSAFRHTQRLSTTDNENPKVHYPAGGDYAFYLSPFDTAADGTVWSREKFNDSQFGMKREAV